VQTVSGLEASLVSLLSHAVACGFVIEIKSNLICTFFNGTKELRFLALFEQFLMCRSSFCQKESFARGNFKRSHRVFISVGRGNESKANAAATNDANIIISQNGRAKRRMISKIRESPIPAISVNAHWNSMLVQKVGDNPNPVVQW
jgi:hypothetical protein